MDDQNTNDQNPAPVAPVAPVADVPAEAPTEQPDLGTPIANEPAPAAPEEAAPAGGSVEEKCATCGGGASAGNCTNCGQNQYGCTCQHSEAPTA